MSLDDRMQSAFNERKESLETTIKPLETSALPAGPTGAISTAIPWVAGAIAALAIVIAVVVLGSGGNNKNIVAADSPPTTEAESNLEPTDDADRKSKKSTEATTQTESSDASDSDNEPEVGSSPSLPFDDNDGGEPTVVTCTAPGYTVAIPVGWHHEACAPFSPAVIPAPGPFEFRPEINLSYDSGETYAQALARINSTLTVLSSSATTVDRHSATLFIIEEEWYDVGQQTLYVVDSGGSSGVFFASGNELVDSNATFTDRAAHYQATLATLDAMLATVDVTYTSPVQKTQPGCVAPTFNNPTPGPSIQADVDGDNQLDTVEIVHHDTGASIVVEAGANVFYVATFANAGIPHVSNDVIAVDLNADGVMEILASTHSGVAGNDYESFYLDGCDLTPIGGATPPLVQRATVINVNSFECSFDAHGKVQLDTTKSVYDPATSDYDHASETFQFDSTNWVSLVSNTSTSANPIQLTGPSTCG